MKHAPRIAPAAGRRFAARFATRLATRLAAIFAAALFLPTAASAASIDLANVPLTTSTATEVKPNLLFVLDDSGSMVWTFMPDTVVNFLGTAATHKYGYVSSQCNGVYYDPNITYAPPAKADGTAYPSAQFTAARDDGFTSTTPARNLNSEFVVNRFVPESGNADYSTYNPYTRVSLGVGGAYYYIYSGTQTRKTYLDTNSDFYKECFSNVGSAPGNAVFAKRRLASTISTVIVVGGNGNSKVDSITVNGFELMQNATSNSNSTATIASNIAASINSKSGTTGYSANVTASTVTIYGPATATDHTPVITKTGGMTFTTDVFPDNNAAKLTNFANWYSFYRTRMLMMKTATGHAFAPIGESYRVGLMRINASNAPLLGNNTFNSAQKESWYQGLYATTYSTGGTPLLRALSNAGRYYAGKLGNSDPIQYSCQQNFTLLSTDGYWNGDGPLRIDGSAFPTTDNQDATEPRPRYDGATLQQTTVTLSYARNQYSCTTGCAGNERRLATQPQKGTCTVTVNGVPTGNENCNPGNWSNNGAATYDACLANNTACLATIPTPNPSVAGNKQVETTVATSTGGSRTNASLADVALYYYNTDLRNSCAPNDDRCTDNVFTSALDGNNKQHMTTFTLGLGAPGRMLYAPCYMSDTCPDNEDFSAVKNGTLAHHNAVPPICPWGTNNAACNWPIPAADQPENIDDLWHAAVNGRGQYFAATNPADLAAGLSSALVSINQRRGAGAAIGVSNMNPVAGNNYAYLSSYTSVSWEGNLEADTINPATGALSNNIAWCAEDTSACIGTMKNRVAANSDTRTIYTADPTGLTPFNAAYAAANPAYFSPPLISGLTQWSSLSGSQQTAATGVNLLNFLRGQHGYEDSNANPDANRLFRARGTVLGDITESKPAFIAGPVFSYPYPGYGNFKTANASRAGMVYVGANDGMLHAFNANTGAESWAYIPGMVVPKLWVLADTQYALKHTNFVNGDPTISDICVANCGDNGAAVWKTILVAGLRGGGRGYFALDITNPANPALLWELRAEGTAGGTIKVDTDVGYGYGNPLITRRASDNKWVVLVTSGYNNTDPGNGGGYLYVLDAGTGAILSKIGTGVGNIGTPSGLAHIQAWNDGQAGNGMSNTAGYTYGGDLLGNVWRFDVNNGAAFRLAELKDGSGNAQPVTTTPILGLSAQKRIVFVATGKYLEVSDLANTQAQSLYAIKDDDNIATLSNPRNTFTQRIITNAGNTRTGATSTVSFSFKTDPGWYVDFPDAGERANVDGILIQGTLIIPTTVPSVSPCLPGGYSWNNYLDYETGLPVDATTLRVGTRYDSPIVGLNVIYIDGKARLIVTDASGKRSIEEGVSFKPLPSFTGKRVIWRELIP